MTTRKLLIWIPLVALLLNGVGYLVLRRSRVPESQSANLATPPETRPAPVAEPDSIEKGQPARRDEEERGFARREAGLAALEAGDYDKALVNLTEARVLLGEKANVAELLRLAEDLRKRPATAAPPTRLRETFPARPAGRLSARPTPRRVATKDDPSLEANSPQLASATGSGLIIVTTTPRGLLVHVDENPVDITPMRSKVRAGTHRVALFDGDRKVYETSLDVKDGATATLFRDFPVEAGTPEASRTPPSNTLPPSGAKDDSATSEPVPPIPAPAIAAPLPLPAILPASVIGTLQISSPGLYGVVWVNGRPRGYPPLEVRDLPVGPAKIEVRVNGVERRSSTVVVQPGLKTPVILRSLEVAP